MQDSIEASLVEGPPCPACPTGWLSKDLVVSPSAGTEARPGRLGSSGAATAAPPSSPSSRTSRVDIPQQIWFTVSMRSLTELQNEMTANGLPFDGTESRVALMNTLRDFLGESNPVHEMDPMKAKDLKAEIAWGTENPFDGIARFLTEDYVLEPKLDGARMRVFLGSEGNSMNTGRRNVKTFTYTDRTDNFPHLRDAVLPHFEGTVLDGEIIAPVHSLTTHTGTVTNSLLNSSVALVNSGPEGSVATQKRFGQAQFWVFDILMFMGESLLDMGWSDRRQLLERVVLEIRAEFPDCDIHLVPTFEASATNIQLCIDNGFEGGMLKRRNSTYQPGKRGPAWLKVKQFSTADCFIVDSKPGEKGNAGLIGSVEVGVFRPDGTVRLVGQVGNWEWEARVAMTDPATRGTDNPTLAPEYLGNVIEVMAQGLGKNGRMRHAHVTRLRPDKGQFDCGEDQLEVFMNV